MVKVKADVGGKGNVYLRAYRKDLGKTISKGEQLPAWSNGRGDTIERFELSLTAVKLQKL